MSEMLSPADARALMNTRSRADWGENKDYPRTAWQHEVWGGDTQRGYWDWVAAQREQEGNDG